MPEYYIGLMSGTSMDAIDAALIDCSNNKLRLVATHTEQISGQTREQIKELCHGCNNELKKSMALDIKLGKKFASCVNSLLKESKLTAKDIIAIGSHGQTIRHYPQDSIRNTLQITDPNTIAEQTGINTIADFRRRDMAAGGQGAPLAPAFHNRIFRHEKNNRVILNLGGIANITILPADKNKAVSGFDTGPANALMNGWIQQHKNKSYDNKGEWAASGSANKDLLLHLLNDNYFKLPPPKSTGTDYFSPAWLTQSLKDFSSLTKEDIQATLCELTAVSVANEIQKHAADCNEVFVCGGGASNKYLMSRLQVHLKTIPVATTDSIDIPADWIEAMAFAWLAKQTLQNKPGNLPEVTGATKDVILGAVYFT